MNVLSFNILPSPDSNDHQIRIAIDNVDWLGDDYLGIDPPRFLQQETFLEGDLLVGRCDCGVEGCGDLIVNVQTHLDKVIWINDEGLNLEFDKSDYLEVVNKSKTDFSWEDINRRVERLVSNLFDGSKTNDGLTFDWASCRIESGKVSLSYSTKERSEEFKQEIFKFDWDGKTENNALVKANRFIQANDRIRK